MKLIKKINNNFALAEDSNGEIIIVNGKGVGFLKMPCEITDLDVISRTFYSTDLRIHKLIKDLPEEILTVSENIFDIARKRLGQTMNENFIFTLADHIHFAIQRVEKGIRFGMGVVYEIQSQYPEEYEIGVWAKNYINHMLKVDLPPEEASILTMHVVEGEVNIADKKYSRKIKNDEVIKSILFIVEQQMGLIIDKNGFDYYRFVMHLQYLLQRGINKNTVTNNQNIFQEVKEQCPEAYQCTQEIKKYLSEKLGGELSDEESLYLMLHVNRLCTAEDCNRNSGMTS